MTEDALDQLRRIVVDDRRLGERLLGAPSREAFVAEVVDVAQAYGIELTETAVMEALSGARRERWGRWV